MVTTTTSYQPMVYLVQCTHYVCRVNETVYKYTEPKQKWLPWSMSPVRTGEGWNLSVGL